MSKKIKVFLLTSILPRMMYTYLRFVSLTSKHHFFVAKDSLEGNFIATFWHGEIPMQGHLYHHILKMRNEKIDIKNMRYGTVISEHSDGEFAAKLYALYGFKGIRGSSTRGGVKALVNALGKLKEKWDIGLTPDGPRGPYHSVANGAVVMALKSQTKIVGFRVEPSKFFQLKSWDKMKIPKPFGEISYYILPPLYLSQEQSLEENKKILQKYLEASPQDYFVE